MANNAKVAKLVMQLVDRVSGPAKAIAGAMGTVTRASRTLMTAGGLPGVIAGGGKSLRSHSYTAGGLSAPIALGAAAAARSVYKFEKAGNAMQAFGLLTEKQRVELEGYAQVLNKDFPFTNNQIIEAAQELFRAGLTFEQAMGALRGTLNLALSGDLAVKEATDIATNVMTAMKLPMKTFDQVQSSMQLVNDALAYAATTSNTDVRLMGDTFRYVAPLAAAAGMSLEEVTAVSAELARNGIKGSEAGVALRSALVRMAKPTKPMLGAFKRLNISMDQFVQYKDKIESGSVLGSLLASGIDASKLTSEIQTILDDKSLAGSPVRMAANLTDLIVKSMGDEALRDTVSEVMQDAVLAGAQKVDLIGLLSTLRDKDATISDIVRIFDVRMGSRLAAVLYSDLEGAVKKMQGESGNISDTMAGLMMQGIVGEWARLLAALENTFIAIGNSGVLASVSTAFEKISEFLNEVSKTNPKLLEFGTYALLAAGAIAPLGLMLSGLASVVAAVASPLGLVVAGLTALTVMKWKGIQAGIKGFGEGFTNNLSPETLERLAWASEKLGELFSWFTAAPDTAAWEAWGNAIGSIVGSVLDFVVQLDTLPGKLYDTGVRIMQSLLDGMKAKAQELLNWATGLAKRLASALFFDMSGSVHVGKAAQAGQAGAAMGALAGKKASGGAVRAGMTYQINEKGIETVTMGRNGYVTKAADVGGRGGMVNHFHISGVTADQVVDKIGRELDRLLSDSRQSSLEGGPIYE